MVSLYLTDLVIHQSQFSVEPRALYICSEKPVLSSSVTGPGEQNSGVAVELDLI